MNYIYGLFIAEPTLTRDSLCVFAVTNGSVIADSPSVNPFPLQLYPVTVKTEN